MSNINKYWAILENLKFPVMGDIKPNKKERLQYNLKELQKTIKLTPEDVIANLVRELNLEHLKDRQTKILGNPEVGKLYSLYALRMLKEITQNVNFSSEAREDLISEVQKSLIIACLEDVASIALQENLHEEFYKDKGALFERCSTLKETNFHYLEFIVEIYSTLIFIKPLYIGTSMNELNLWYMAAIFSLFLASDSKQYELEQMQISNLQSKLHKMWLELSKKLYYRNLMLLYSTLSHSHKSRIHKEMLLRLWSTGGFMALLFAMTHSQRNEEQPMDEMVARLVAQPSYSTKAQQSLLKQILQFLPVSLKNTKLIPHLGAGILSLRKLYDNKIENRDFLKNWLKQQMLPLIESNQENLVAMEWCDFNDLISLLFHTFCTSTVACLPSELLIPYLRVFIEIYSELLGFDNQETLKHHLSSLILKILNNRSKEDLKNIIEYLAKQSYPTEWYYSTINIKENPLNSQELKLTLTGVNDTNSKEDYLNPLTSLVVILKQSSHNLLIYQIFIILLQLVPNLVLDNENSTHVSDKPSNIDLLESKEDLYNRVLIEFSQKYERKMYTIKALETLVQHPTLKPLIHDNISELLVALHSILTEFASNEQISSNEMNKTALMILLILIREIIESSSSNQEDFYKTLFKPLKQLEKQVNDVNLKYQIAHLLQLLKGETIFSSIYDPKKNQFEEARSLIESKESYLQVEGLEKMIKLLKQRQEFAVANYHVVTALALNTLKSPESYTFLNCVRLFVSLVNVNESEVLELLADEYLNYATTMDYRLVIGEAILKVSRELGPLCYKHKNVLLNTYMSGCRSSFDEFRFSSFSNLSQMCRILTYQVHNYFQELLHLINCELTSGKYLPAKRAAVMVLSDLLAGMDNLFDYEDMLLPIYRLLKFLVSSEQNDEKIRLHASNGLGSLAEKCKELFKTALEQRPLEKEIKIMGIRDQQPKRSLKNHILEMN